MKTSNLYWDAKNVFLTVMNENTDCAATHNKKYSSHDQRNNRLIFLRDVRQFIPFQQRLYMIQLARRTYNEYLSA